MIVGRLVETYLEIQPIHTGFRGFIVIKHAVVKDLHATKGWRTVKHHKERQTRTSRPDWREVKANCFSEYRRR